MYLSILKDYAFLNEIQALIPLALKFCSLQIVRNLTVHSNLMGDLLKV